MKVITGYSNRRDGLLIVTDKGLSEVAEANGMIHDTVGGQDFFRYVLAPFDEQDLRNIAAGETPRQSYRIYVSDVQMDVNLSAAVCW